MAKFKSFLKSNISVLIYIVLAIFIELVSITFIDCKPFLTAPLYAICLLGIFVFMLFLIPNVKVKATIGVILLLLQTALNVGFIYLYDSNGTYFEWAMVNQRTDAAGTIEEIFLRWWLLGICLALIVAYIVAVVIINKKVYKNFVRFRQNKLSAILTSIMLCICTVFVVLSPTITAISNRNLSYVQRYLYGDADNKYQRLGISSNAVYEAINGNLTNALVKHNADGVDEFIDAGGTLEHTPYYGISKNNNLVYILVESLEWYPFLSTCSKEQAEVLYPHLLKFMDDSIYADNFYSREKTDTAEMLAIVGSNPTGKFISYDFPTNAYPWALPNLFRDGVKANGGEVKQVLSFHQSDGNFYNRNTMHESFGFDMLYDITEMTDYGLIKTWGGKNKERTLDSRAVEAMQEVMFPTTQAGEQYFSFWITFSMHGVYRERNTLKQAGYYDLMDSVNAYPVGDKKQNYLRTYAATVMDFDRAVGIMMERLKQNGQLDNTTIVMFADHNTYYHNLAMYAKDISNRYNPELYRVPFIIYDTKLKEKYEADTGSNVISKFTTTADMLPTIIDLFGIDGYKNLYFGSSMFSDSESIIYSRAYGVFLTDKLMCYSAKDLIYTVQDFSDEDYNSFISRAELLLNKLENLDKIYYNNYYKTHEYKKLTA